MSAIICTSLYHIWKYFQQRKVLVNQILLYQYDVLDWIYCYFYINSVVSVKYIYFLLDEFYVYFHHKIFSLFDKYVKAFAWLSEKHCDIFNTLKIFKI